MQHVPITYWKDTDYYIGYLNNYPDYETQGITLEELESNLVDLFHDLESNTVPFIRHVSELVIA